MRRNPAQAQYVGDIQEVIYGSVDQTVKCVTYCLSYCCAGFFYKKPQPRLLPNQDVSQKLKECIALIESHNNDMLEIEAALKTCRVDVNTSYAEAKAILTAYQAQYMIQQSSEAYDRNVEQRINMLNTLSELLDNYPKLEPEDESSLDRLNVFYTERDEHHQNVMKLVEIYLPETYAALKEAQPTLKMSS